MGRAGSVTRSFGVERGKSFNCPLERWNVVQGVPVEHGLRFVAEQAHRLGARDAGLHQSHRGVAAQIVKPTICEPGLAASGLP
jgi:hypothetical protein